MDMSQIITLGLNAGAERRNYGVCFKQILQLHFEALSLHTFKVKSFKPIFNQSTDFMLI